MAHAFTGLRVSECARASMAAGSEDFHMNNRTPGAEARRPKKQNATCQARFILEGLGVKVG